MGSKRRGWVRVSVGEAAVESLCALELGEVSSSDMLKLPTARGYNQSAVMKHEQ